MDVGVPEAVPYPVYNVKHLAAASERNECDRCSSSPLLSEGIQKVANLGNLVCCFPPGAREVLTPELELSMCKHIDSQARRPQRDGYAQPTRLHDILRADPG